MTEFAIVFAFLSGSFVTWMAMRSQLSLLSGIVKDRHAGDLARVGIKTSSVVQMPPNAVQVGPEQPYIENAARVDLSAPNLFNRRADVERREALQKRVNV